ncbi:MAG: HAMP domain-containing sensor histidine kinase [Clostridia bacterium]|nr:HAMP domain-containing sensor histidine kinase [Clostridia bacterium]
MKTISRLVRRYIAAAFAIVLLILLFNIAAFLGVLTSSYNVAHEKSDWRIGSFAASFSEDEAGVLRPEESANTQSLLSACAWAMLLDDEGNVLWRHNLPESLDHRYTVSQVASFSRWYWADYPVFTYLNDYGIVVAGMPKGSYVRFDYYINATILDGLLSALPKLLLVDGALVIAVCLLLGFRASRPLREVGRGIDALSRGEEVELAEHGMTAELAGKLNRTSALLAGQRKAIAKRDSARTNWIAGVSHDIRTPLSLIFGHAEQLERAASLPEAQQKKAAAIRVQAQRIRMLIEDLNLTSKLQYDAQPLRLEETLAGPFLRQVMTDFCNSPLCERCTVGFDMDAQAGQTSLLLDGALCRRALENLLLNSVRHNPQGCALSVTVRGGEALSLTVSDDGVGYPEKVLLALDHPDSVESPPHILGLHLVRQIVLAHGGRVSFANGEQGGAIALITLPAHPRAGGVPALPHSDPRRPPRGKAQARRPRPR